MSVFSSMLDISSFFIGVLMNLLLVAMICFYFKRKIDNLELSQSEQAKILFQLLQENNNKEKQSAGASASETYHVLNNLDLTELAGESEEIQGESYDDDADAVHGSDNEEDSDDDSDSDSDEEEVKTIEYEQKTNEEYDLETIEKKTIKELRALLEENGVKITRKNVKKQELIELFKQHMMTPVVEEVIKVESEPEPEPEPDVESETEEVNVEKENNTVEEVQLELPENNSSSMEIDEVKSVDVEIDHDSSELL